MLNPRRIDFAFDEDFIFGNDGQLALTSEIEQRPQFNLYGYKQDIDQSIGINRGEIAFYAEYGAGLERMFGHAVSQSLIDFGKREIIRTLNDIAPNVAYKVDGYYLKSFNENVLYTISIGETLITSVVVDVNGSINVIGN